MSKSKRWTAAEKAQIVLEGLRGETNLAELSRRHFALVPTGKLAWQSVLDVCSDRTNEPVGQGCEFTATWQGNGKSGEACIVSDTT